MIKICAFGEILIRLTPGTNAPFSSLPQTVEFTFGGSEVNFLAHAAGLGAPTSLITAIPGTFIGNAALRYLHKCNINTKYVTITDQGRLGIYFREEGTALRPSDVLYDREHTTVNAINFEDFPFIEAFSNNDLFHISGITPALSEKSMYTALRSVRLAKEMGLEVSCDLNYQNNLWHYLISDEKPNIEKVMQEIAAYCDYLVGTEADYLDIFNISLKDKHYKNHDDKIVYYQNLLLQVSKRFPHIKKIAVSIRDTINADAHYIGAALYKRETNQFFFSPNVHNKFVPYLVQPIIDAGGTGDAFCSGLIIGLHRFEDEKLQQVLDFATASCVLKHTYRGDMSYATSDLIQSLMHGDKFGKIKK